MHKKQHISKNIIITCLSITLIMLIIKLFPYINILLNTKASKVDFPTSLSYRIIKPDKKHQSYPLLVMLHGTGARGSYNFKPVKTMSLKVLKEISNKYGTCILIPQCKNGNYWIQKKTAGFNNFNTFNLNMRKSKSIESVEQIIKKIIPLEKIDTTRIYCVGHSMGGGGTVALSIRNPNLFAAIIPISCAVDHYNATLFAKTPSKIVIGDKDPIFTIEQIDSLVSIVKKIKDAEIQLEIFKGADHNIYQKVVLDKDIMNWLFNHQKHYAIQQNIK